MTAVKDDHPTCGVFYLCYPNISQNNFNKNLTPKTTSPISFIPGHLSGKNQGVHFNQV